MPGIAAQSDEAIIHHEGTKATKDDTKGKTSRIAQNIKSAFQTCLRVLRGFVV